MSSLLHIQEMVVTGDDLARAHQGQEGLCVVAGAVLTPTAWDYIRDQRLRLTRGASKPESSKPVAPSASTNREVPVDAQPRSLAPVLFNPKVVGCVPYISSRSPARRTPDARAAI